MDQIDDGLLSLLPPIRRARGWRLYAEDGRRFLDLWQDDGRGILGAKGTGIGTVAKAGVDQGLAIPLPSVWKERLAKEALRLYPEWEVVRFFPDEGGANEWLASQGIKALLLRPFAEFLTAGPAAGSEACLLRLPCPRALSPAILFLRGGAAALAAASTLGPQVPPLLLSTAAKGLVEFRGFCGSYNEDHWRRADRRLSGLFERRGPYLLPRCAAADYPGLFRKALDLGVLLSPCHNLASLLPGDFDDGELARLATLS